MLTNWTGIIISIISGMETNVHPRRAYCILLLPMNRPQFQRPQESYHDLIAFYMSLRIPIRGMVHSHMDMKQNLGTVPKDSWLMDVYSILFP